MVKEKPAPPSPSARQIGRNLRHLREKAGLAQKDIAAVLGVSFQQVQKYESGRNHLPMDKLLVLKAFYGVGYEVFFSGITTQKIRRSE